MNSLIFRILSPQSRRFVIGLTAVWLGTASAPRISAASDVAKDASQQAFADELKGRKDVAKAIKDGQEPIAALASLNSARNLSDASPAKTRLQHGWAVVDVGMQLVSNGDSASAQKIFVEAERILDKAARSFASDESHDRAQALFALGHVRTAYLRKQVEAMDAFDAALVDDPENPAIQTAKRRLAAEWGRLIEDARAKAKQSTPSA